MTSKHFPLLCCCVTRVLAIQQPSGAASERPVWPRVSFELGNCLRCEGIRSLCAADARALPLQLETNRENSGARTDASPDPSDEAGKHGLSLRWTLSARGLREQEHVWRYSSTTRPICASYSSPRTACMCSLSIFVLSMVSPTAKHMSALNPLAFFGIGALLDTAAR